MDNIIRPEQLIYSLWDQVMRQGHGALVPDLWTRPDIAMYFHVRVDVSNFGYENDGNTHHKEWERHFYRNVHVLVTARHRCYVAVVENEFDITRVPAEAWKNTSNHDSCWHSDGLRVFHEVLDQAWEHCWSHIPEEHRRSPNQMHSYCTFGAGLASPHVLSFVKIKRRDTADHYFDGLESVTPVKFKLSIEDTE